MNPLSHTSMEPGLGKNYNLIASSLNAATIPILKTLSFVTRLPLNGKAFVGFLLRERIN